MSSLRIVLTLILALFLALVVACDGGSDGPEPPTGDVRGPTSVTVAPEPVSTPTPLEPLLTQDIPPCTPAEGTSVGPCEPGTGLVHLAFASERIDDEPFSIRWYLGSEGSGSGLHASHLVVRGTHLPETVRCVPEFLFQAGGEGTPELLDSIKCYTDIRVNEYLLGSGPSTLTVLVHHGKYREAMDQEEIDRSTSRLERALIEGGRWDQLSTGGIIGREAVLFLGPEDNREVEVWEIFTGWTLVERQNEDDTTTVLAIHPHSGYWAREDAAEWEQQRSTLFEVPLPTFRQAITAAHSGRVADFGGRTSRKPDAPMLVSAASELRQFLTSVGAYSDPNDVPKKPGEPCGKVVANQVDNPGLMVDCLELLALKDALRGTGTLNWGTDTAMSSWAGVTTAGTPSRITKVEVADESLSGTIPGSLGGLAKLTHLDLSNNSLTGQIPEELDQLSNLTNLKLSGNAGLTGCIPKALRSVSTNDLSSLSISYCPSEPQSLTVGTPGENSIPLSWDAVANATRYRVEELRGRKWVVVDDTITATSYAVEDLYCSQQYRFQVRAYVTDWSGPSSVIETHAGACVPPTIGSSTYSFTARSDEGTVVGSISATGSLGADDQVAYVIHPDDLADGKFAMNVDTGEITFAKDLAAEVGKTVEITVFIFDKSGGYAEIPANITVTASCSSGTAVPSPTANTGLVEDCKTLLDLKSELAGTGTLNWSGDLAMSDWSGISTGGTPKRVIGVKLKNSGLGGVIPAALGDLAQLQDLWLGGNQLTGEIPPELGNLTSLYSLYLDQNRLTGEIPAELGSLSVLEDLFLYNNQLTGSIPPEVAGLEDLRQLWITNNQLTGVLPGELADLEELYNLRLSGNSFEGCVPAGLRDVATNDVSSLGLEDCPAGVVPAPTGLSASLAEGIFTLTWNAVPDADYYNVYYGDRSSCSLPSSTLDTLGIFSALSNRRSCEELAADLIETTYTHTSPGDDENYYWVVACNSGGCTDIDTGDPAAFVDTRPSAPGNFEYRRDGSVMVVSWSAATNADYYKIYYDDTFDSSCRLNSSGITVGCEELATNVVDITYTHTSPDADENYYWVVACNRNGCTDIDSENPATFVDTRPSAPPANVQYRRDGTAIVVSWSAAPDADYYKIYYDEFRGSSCRLNSSGITVGCEELATNVVGTTYTHTSPDDDYNHYGVVACNRNGCTDIDSEIPATFVDTRPSATIER